MNLTPPLIPVILCGGVGSRLWPVSRDLRPKPFIRMADGESLLQKAFLRAAVLPGVEEILTVSNRELFFQVEDEYRAAGFPQMRTTHLLEPVQRNTAAAVAAAALQVQAEHGDAALMLVLAADHLIQDQPAFAAAVERAAALAQAGRIVTFGIRPDRAETGYGYIEVDAAGAVARFVEKPDAERALAFSRSGRHLWNAGMFCFTAGTLLAELQLHAPEILTAVRACRDVSRTVRGAGMTQVDLEPETFARVPASSIDVALMEKTGRISVVPCDIGWSDVGSWDAVGELTAADSDDNRVQGDSLLHDTHGCVIHAGARLVGAVGLHNLIIVDTPDALLVADRSRSQEVRHLYTQLKDRGHEAHKQHQTVHRPWGTYTVLGEGPGFKIKRLEVRPGASLSLQLHHHRSEHWVVVSGVASVRNGEADLTIAANQSTYIPAGTQHRLANRTAEPLVVIEVQSGHYLQEDDIVRFDDRYGRVPAPAAVTMASHEACASDPVPSV